MLRRVLGTTLKRAWNWSGDQLFGQEEEYNRADDELLAELNTTIGNFAEQLLCIADVHGYSNYGLMPAIRNRVYTARQDWINWIMQPDNKRTSLSHKRRNSSPPRLGLPVTTNTNSTTLAAQVERFRRQLLQNCLESIGIMVDTAQEVETTIQDWAQRAKDITADRILSELQGLQAINGTAREFVEVTLEQLKEKYLRNISSQLLLPAVTLLATIQDPPLQLLKDLIKVMSGLARRLNALYTMISQIDLGGPPSRLLDEKLNSLINSLKRKIPSCFPGAEFDLAKKKNNGAAAAAEPCWESAVISALVRLRSNELPSAIDLLSDLLLKLKSHLNQSQLPHTNSNNNILPAVSTPLQQPQVDDSPRSQPDKQELLATNTTATTAVQDEFSTPAYSSVETLPYYTKIANNVSALLLRQKNSPL